MLPPDNRIRILLICCFIPKNSKERLMRKLNLLAALTGLFVAANAFGYGDAGCGLGSMLFEKNTVLSQLAAGTTNGIMMNQWFGMTSGTSNCKTNGFVQVNREQVYFAEANFSNLQSEMAKGQGETLVGFAQVLGCDAASFSKMTQEKYESIFPSANTTPGEMLFSVKKQIQENKALADSCSVG